MRRWSRRKARRIASKEDLAKLRADVESREEEVKRLEAKAKATEGTKARSFVGEGDRQYLTGLKIGGQHILLAIDTSASMLDDTIVNVIRRRNMSDDSKREAPKWRRAVRTVEWLAAQFPLDSQFQIYGFNEDSQVDGRRHDRSMDRRFECEGSRTFSERGRRRPFRPAARVC